MLSRDPRLTVTEHCPLDAPETVRARVRAVAPDVVVLHLREPCAAVGALVRALRTDAAPALGLLVVGVDSLRHDVLSCIEQGIVAYLPEDPPPEALAQGVLRAQRHQALAPPLLVHAIFHRLHELAELEGRRALIGLLQLSRRQREVLALLVRQLSNARIADILSLSENTIKSHVNAILRALGVRNRREAARVALDHGWFAFFDETSAA
ncbi:MAG: response regulator transcription factor [Acidobacteriota bacterium]